MLIFSAYLQKTAGRGLQYRPFLKIKFKGEPLMLWTIAVILVILWLLGFVSSYTMGGFIHILLVIAIIVVLVNVIGGRRIT